MVLFVVLLRAACITEIKQFEGNGEDYHETFFEDKGEVKITIKNTVKDNVSKRKCAG